MKILDFVTNYKNKNFMNTKLGVEERIEWIKNELEIKSYIPFNEKRKIAEMIVNENIKEVDGIKKYDSIDGYIAFIAKSIMAHTNLEFGDHLIDDYDLLAESGLLPHIIAQFQGSHDEIGLLRKMVLDMELEDNNISVLVGRFLNKVSGGLDGLLEVAKNKFGDFDMRNIFGSDINDEDLTKLIGIVNKLK